MLTFSIAQWQGWTSGMQDTSSWLHWAEHPYCPVGEPSPPRLEFLPPMQRRRLSPLARAAFECAWPVAHDHPPMPLVFASRHGETTRNFGLLQALAAGEALSPTAFGLSVHNAIAALYSIARGHRGNYLALAAGQATVETACLEAAGLLADGAREVRVVVYESRLPEIYATFADEPDPFFAWCWRLTAPTPGQPTLSLQWEAAPEATATAPGALPHALDLHRFLLSGAPALEHVAQGQRWRWGRRG